MPRERHQLNTAVFMILEKDNKILLSKRQNTGYMDGFYGLPAGHVEAGEGALGAAVRELREELGIEAQKSDLSFAHVLIHSKKDETGEWLNTFFRIKKWQGEVDNLEPQKCAGLLWWDGQTKVDMVPNIRVALDNIRRGEYYTEVDFN